MKELNWSNNLRNILDKDELYNVIPTKTMDYTEKKRTTIRLFLYISIILSLLTNNMGYVLMFILVYIIFNVYDIEFYQNTPDNKMELEHLAEIPKKSETILELDRFTDDKFAGIGDSSNVINSDYTEQPGNDCVKPTKHNPFMNFLPFTKITDKKACPITEDIETETLKYVNTYPNLDNYYTPDASLLPFSFLPRPIDGKDELYDWLYKVPFSCKIGSGNLHTRKACHIFID